MTEDRPQPPTPTPNIGVWVGLGCLGVLVLSCCLVTFWLQSYGLRFVMGQGDGTKIWFSRIILIGALEGTRKTCNDGAVSEDALPWFHPRLAAEARNRACSLDEATLQALTSPDQTWAIPLIQTDRAELGRRFGMDPALCFEHSAGDMKVVGCFDAEGGPDSTPYQIIDLTLGPQ
jgi:hypothetical protein